MSLNKKLLIPGYGFEADHIRVDRIDLLDPLARDARFTAKVYRDSILAAVPGCQGFPVATIRAINESFDRYFSRKALHESQGDVFGLAYEFAIDWTAAYDQNELVQAHVLLVKNNKDPKAVLPEAPTPLTEEQASLLASGFISGGFGPAVLCLAGHRQLSGLAASERVVGSRGSPPPLSLWEEQFSSRQPH